MTGCAPCSVTREFGWGTTPALLPTSPRCPWRVPVPMAGDPMQGHVPCRDTGWRDSPGTSSAGKEMPPEPAQSCKSGLPLAVYTYGMRFIYEGERACKEEL